MQTAACSHGRQLSARLEATDKRPRPLRGQVTALRLDHAQLALPTMGALRGNSGVVEHKGSGELEGACSDRNASC